MFSRRSFVGAGASAATALLIPRVGLRAAEPKRIVPVATHAALKQAFTRAKAGDLILLADGAYAGINLEIKALGTALDPIVIRAQTPLQAELPFRLRLKGAHTIVEGVYMNGQGVDIGGSYNRVTRCKLRCDSGNAINFMPGDHGEYDHCDVTVTPPRTYGEVKCGANWQSSAGTRPHTYAHIHHNYFHDFPPKLVVTDYHSSTVRPIRLGGSTNSSSTSFHALVEYNLLERITPGYGEGSLEVKASDCTVRFNTLINSPKARLQLRHGLRNRWEGNWVENCGGFNVRGVNSTVLGNTLINATLRILAGDNELPKNESATSMNVHIAGNQGPIVLGENNGVHTVPAKNLTFEQHRTGNITIELVEALTDRRFEDSSVPFTAARKLTLEEVGPFAP